MRARLGRLTCAAALVAMLLPARADAAVPRYRHQPLYTRHSPKPRAVRGKNVVERHVVILLRRPGPVGRMGRLLYPANRPPVVIVSWPTTTTTTAVLTDATSVHTADWACIRFHESGSPEGDYTIVGDALGAYQFQEETWQMLGYAGEPQDAPPWEQDQAALRLYAWDEEHTGNPWSAWSTAPLCGL